MIQKLLSVAFKGDVLLAGSLSAPLTIALDTDDQRMWAAVYDTDQQAVLLTPLVGPRSGRTYTVPREMLRSWCLAPEEKAQRGRKGA
jgi:hypothetical protein